MTTRRQTLTYLAGALSGAGVLTLAAVLKRSMDPTGYRTPKGFEGVRTIDISKLQPGQVIAETFLGNPLVIMKRTPEMLAMIEKENQALEDPDSANSEQPPEATNRYRSIQPDMFVVMNVCTHLGCATGYMDIGQQELLKEGGFFCPCHGAKYDLAGRVYKNMPAPKNLLVPEYELSDDGNELRVFRNRDRLS